MLYRLVRVQEVYAPLSEVWYFFSRPENLSTLTPSYMAFQILSEVPENMEAGILIEYIVRPLWGIPLRWVTEITHVKSPLQGSPPYFFVDEQRFGPYAFWHHRHEFYPVEKGVLMRDIVHYKLPGKFLGQLIHPLLIRPRLEEIFNFREKKIREIFNYVDAP
ncbi:MAG: SRPBCC family protein [Bacteroidia bacterium]|nr:SRPBCC family protein [Bacteroidia bacterium]